MTQSRVSVRQRIVAISIIGVILAWLGMMVPVAAADTDPSATPPSQVAPPTPPLPITASATATHHDVIGTITLPKAVFTILVDGSEVTTISSQPIIAPTASNDGSYAWGFTIPSSIADGAHRIKIMAVPAPPTPLVGTVPISSSDLVTTDSGKTNQDTVNTGQPTPPTPLPFTVDTVGATVPPVVTEVDVVLSTAPPPPSPDPLPVVTTPGTGTITTTQPPLPLAPQIGQFIAPTVTTPMNGAPTVQQTQLYGVPVTDLVSSSSTPVEPTQKVTYAPAAQPVQTTAPASSGTAPASTAMSAPQVDRPAATAAAEIPLSTADDGWHIFGVSWYWAMIGVGLIAVGVFLIGRSMGWHIVIPQVFASSSQ